MAVREILDNASVLQAGVVTPDERPAVRETVVIDPAARLEQALHEAHLAQQRWQKTFDAVDALVVVVDRDHRIVAANKAACKSAPGKEIVGMHCYELFHGMTSPRPNCPFEESLRTGRPARGEWSEPNFKGRWLDVATYPIMGKDGSVEQLVHIVHDVTERRSAQERFRLLFNSSRDALTTGAPPSGRFTSGNAAAVAMFRAKNEEEFCLHGPWDISPERQPDGRLSAEKARELIEKAMREGSLFFEWTHKRLDGEEFPANVLLTRVEQDGQLIVLATVRDITDQKRAEEELRTSEEQLSNALEMALAANWEYDVASDTFKFNDNFYRIFHTTAEQSGGYQMRSAEYARRFCHPDDAPMVSKGIRAAIETTDPAYNGQLEHRILYADGTIGYIAVRFFIVKDGHGRTIRTYGVNQNITARKRREEALKAKTADMERANEEVKQFAYIVSHDFRAPLVNLKGFAGEIRSSLSAIAPVLQEALTHLSEEQRKTVVATLQTDIPEDLQFIETAASNMDSYVNALLKLSRLGRQELRPERLRVGEIVERSLKALAHQMSERSAVACVEALPEAVADRTAMEQIMGNILTNAVLYLEPGRPGRIEVGGSSGPDETTFFIRDNGRGVAPEDMPKVFAPFRRAGKQDVKGEGMGLAYVRMLVRRHGGEIRCESRPGVGTTFTFTIRNSIEKGKSDAHTPTNRA